MTVNESLAQLSNGMVYTSMVVYAGSFLGFAASFANGRGQQDESEAARGSVASTKRNTVDVTNAASVSGAGATATLTKTDPDDEAPLPPGRRAGHPLHATPGPHGDPALLAGRDHWRGATGVGEAPGTCVDPWPRRRARPEPDLNWPMTAMTAVLHLQ